MSNQTMNPQPQLGSNLLFPRGNFLHNPIAVSLSTIDRYLDPDVWVKANYAIHGQYWHMAWICGKWADGDWMVRSMNGQGAEYLRLSQIKEYKLVNWGRKLTQDECDDYIDHIECVGYDVLGYVWCALNRITNNKFPKVVDNRFYCWEDVSYKDDFFGQSWMNEDNMGYCQMPFMPLFIQQAILKGVW
jgi:hypothetical protein